MAVPAATKLSGIATFGSALHPFNAQAPVNCRPINPVLTTTPVIQPTPQPTWLPQVAPDGLCLKVHTVNKDNLSRTVYGCGGGPGYNPAGFFGLKDPNIGSYTPSIVFNHFPYDPHLAAGVGSSVDGHFVLIDETTNILHDFYNFHLDPTTDNYTASIYKQVDLTGTGLGTAAAPYMGVRSSGWTAAMGLIRTHEVSGYQASWSYFYHALVCSLDYSSLQPTPGHVWPAFTNDSDAATTNKGKGPNAVPIGARLMLDPNFDTTQFKNLYIRKIANTAKVFGILVGDRNYGTPIKVYSEFGCGITTTNADSADLWLLSKSLKMMTSCSGYLDGNLAPVPQ